MRKGYQIASKKESQELREFLAQQGLGLWPMLRRCLATTNVIESSLSGVAGRTRRVTNWRDGEMALRWAAAAALETEKHFRKRPAARSWGIGICGGWRPPCRNRPKEKKNRHHQLTKAGSRPNIQMGAAQNPSG